MKKIWKYFFLLLSTSVTAQNLVPNPSFEDTVACPNTVDQVYDCQFWNSSGDSPDYYNACAPNIVNVPNTALGYQQAATGNAFCGLFNFAIPTYREYIGSQLISPLQVGVKYFASFKANLVGNIGHNCKSNKIGLLFSTVPFSQSTPPAMNNFAHIFSQALISDSINWQTVSGSFIADSNYQYIIIGNFFDNNNTDTLDCFGGVWSSYLYVDDACVSTDSLTCNPNPEGILQYRNEILSTYPNPTDGIFFIALPENSLCELIVYNELGYEIIHKALLEQVSEIDLRDYSRGIYFVKVEISNATIVRKVILI